MTTPADVPSAVWRRTRRTVNRALGSLETARGGGPERLAHPPIFILGAPRSGSTLLYQLMVDAFDVGYISNLHCRLFGAPSLVERALRRRPPARVAYESVRGGTRGASAPSECGEYWYRFFRRRPQYVPLEDADPEKMRRLRASVRALGDAARRPLVFKNLICSLRLGPIGTTLPEALFVVVRRDLVATAASLLASRREVSGDYGRWWSAEPPEIDRLRALPPHEQVVEQVRGIEGLIRRDRERLGRERFLELRYEEICEDPRATSDVIAAFTAERGVELTRRRAVPERFEPRGVAVLEDGLRERLVSYVQATPGS